MGYPYNSILFGHIQIYATTEIIHKNVVNEKVSTQKITCRVIAYVMPTKGHPIKSESRLVVLRAIVGTGRNIELLFVNFFCSNENVLK